MPINEDNAGAGAAQGQEGEAESVRRSRGVLPKFKGLESDDISRFVARVDAHKTQHKLDDKQTVEAVSDCLDGRAWSWFDNIQKKNAPGKDVWKGADRDAPCLRALLLKRYARKMTPAQIAQAMTDTRMEPKESVDDFLDRCEALQFRIEGDDYPREGDNKAAYDIMHEGAVKTLFLSGLSQELKKTALTTAKGAALADYAEAARTAETSIKQVTRQINELKLRTVDDNGDEVELDMPSSEEIAWMYASFRGRGRGRGRGGRGRGGRGRGWQGGQQSGAGGAGRGRGDGQDAGSSGSGGSGRPCYNCWERGHIAKDCPNPSKPYPGATKQTAGASSASSRATVNSISFEGEWPPTQPPTAAGTQQDFHMQMPW